MKIASFLALGIALCVIFNNLAFAIDNPKCKVPHEPFRWHLAYCMIKGETDDMESVQSSPCMDEKVPPNVNGACAENAFWKEKWCSLYVNNIKNKTVNQCIEDKKMIPNGVKDGF